MTLPSTSPSQQDPSSTKEPPAVAKKGRVLIVEIECLISKTVAVSDLIKRLEIELLR